MVILYVTSDNKTFTKKRNIQTLHSQSRKQMSDDRKNDEFQIDDRKLIFSTSAVHYLHFWKSKLVQYCPLVSISSIWSSSIYKVTLNSGIVFTAELSIARKPIIESDVGCQHVLICQLKKDDLSVSENVKLF